MNTIGERMKFIISQNHLTTSEVAKKMEIPYKNMYRYCNDIRTPSNEFLYQFSKMYNANFEWLLMGITSESKNDIPFDSLPYKEQFQLFLKDYQKENFAFMRGETDYKEPMMMKSFRVGILKTSRKTMKRLMIQGYRDMGYNL